MISPFNIETAKGAAYAAAVIDRYVSLLRDVCQGDLY